MLAQVGGGGFTSKRLSAVTAFSLERCQHISLSLTKLLCRPSNWYYYGSYRTYESNGGMALSFSD